MAACRHPVSRDDGRAALPEGAAGTGRHRRRRPARSRNCRKRPSPPPRQARPACYGIRAISAGKAPRSSIASVRSCVPTAAKFYDPKTSEITINQPQAVEALEFWGDLMTKHHAVVARFDHLGIRRNHRRWPERPLCDGGDADAVRHADQRPAKIQDRREVGMGADARRKISAQSHTFFGGWSLAVASAGKHKEWAFEFIQMACSNEWMRRSMLRGNAPPRLSVLNDPEMVEKFGCGAGCGRCVADRLARSTRSDLGDAGVQLRSGCRRFCSGRNPPKMHWTALRATGNASPRRAGAVQSGEANGTNQTARFPARRGRGSDRPDVCACAIQTGQVGVRRRQRTLALVPCGGVAPAFEKQTGIKVDFTLIRSTR